MIENEEKILEEWKSYPMKRPYISKVVVDICDADSNALDKAAAILESLTEQTPVRSRAKQTIRDFGISKKKPIAVRVTLRHEKAREFLVRALKAKDGVLLYRNWDEDGNFAFGISEHIDIPDVKYDPNLGVSGMNITVCVERPGYRVKRRLKQRSHVPWRHRMTPQESMLFVKKEFGVEILEKERERTYTF
ncbi:MAG: 50S ribosomal protein L5 [Candidatus Thorarchaeota archaeon]